MISVGRGQRAVVALSFPSLLLMTAVLISAFTLLWGHKLSAAPAGSRAPVCCPKGTLLCKRTNLAASKASLINDGNPGISVQGGKESRHELWCLLPEEDRSRGPVWLRSCSVAPPQSARGP